MKENDRQVRGRYHRQREGFARIVTVQQQWPLYSAGMCTIEGNTGIIAATGTTPLAATTGCSHVCQAISQAL